MTDTLSNTSYYAKYARLVCASEGEYPEQGILFKESQGLNPKTMQNYWDATRMEDRIRNGELGSASTFRRIGFNTIALAFADISVLAPDSESANKLSEGLFPWIEFFNKSELES